MVSCSANTTYHSLQIHWKSVVCGRVQHQEERLQVILMITACLNVKNFTCRDHCYPGHRKIIVWSKKTVVTYICKYILLIIK